MAEVVTGEAVVLDLAVARFPSRILALLIDVLVQLPILLFVEVVALLAGASHLNDASAAAVLLSGVVGVLVGYPVVFETLSRGKTLGKMAVGIRVVSDDGGPERFRQALIRALSLVFIEFWLPPFDVIGLPAGLITSMVSAKGKRLGDMFAGTFVIQERVPQRAMLAPVFTVVPPPLAGWAQHLELSRLPDQTAAAASSFLRRYYELVPAARDQLGLQLASAVAAQVSPPPPPGTPPAAFLAAVLAVRREREQARLQSRLGAQQAPPVPGTWQAPPAPGTWQAPPAPGAWQAPPVSGTRQAQPAPGADFAPVDAFAEPRREPTLPYTAPVTMTKSPARETGPADAVDATVTAAGPRGQPGPPPDDLGFVPPF